MVDKCRVLMVDDDERLLKAAKRILHKDVELHTALGGAAALELLQASEPFAVLVSDQNMPEMDGATLLAEVSKRWPMMVRIMLTGNNDLSTAVTAVNSGHIFRFLNKPCKPKDLLAAILDGQRQYNLLAGEKSLLEKTLSGSVKVLVDVLALANPRAFQKASKVRSLTREISKYVKFDRPWELEIASMLWPLGAIALPTEVAVKLAAGELLSTSEQELVEQSPQSARELIFNIPRMENIADAIYYCAKGYDGSGFPYDDVRGDKIPDQARLLHILIDLVEAKSDKKQSDFDAFKTLMENSHLYDPAMLKALGELLRNKAQSESQSEQIKTVTPAGLFEGDVVADDIIDNQDQLLLAAGNELTKLMIARLRNMDKLKLLTQPIRVKRAEPANELAS